MKTYANTFSYNEPSQMAFVRILLGEIEESAKKTIVLKGIFERETE